MERVADYLVRSLHRAGVEHIFLVTGRGILFFSDAVAKEDGVEAVPAYHEQGASYAAMAYAQARDDLGACLVSTGCAATNAMTAALCAWQDNVPVVFLSGQHMLKETTTYTGLPIRTYGSQEADIIQLVKPITKYAVMLTDARQTVAEMEKALYLAMEGRRGPVWIDVPLDVQNRRIAPETLPHFVPPVRLQQRMLDRQVAKVAADLDQAKHPLLLIGGGGRGLQTEIAALVERTNLPVIFTPTAADIYGAGHDLSIGAVSSIGGSRAGNFTLQNADYILAVGTKLCSQMTGNDLDSFARAADITVVDIDPIEHTKAGEPVSHFVNADAREFLSALLKKDLQQQDSVWTRQCLHWKKVFSLSEEVFLHELAEQDEIDLYQLMDVLDRKLSDNATVITDAGFEELIIPSSLRFRVEQRCLFPAAQGAMGYAIPAIMGAHFAGRENIICIVGDGSIMMNLQELQAIRQQQIPVKLFVISNDMYAVIRKRQKDLFRRRTIGTGENDGVSAPDFQQVAVCFGFDYQKISSLQELSAGLDQALCTEGPLLCEIICTSEQKYLHQSYGLTEKHRLEIRPLEDLSPFLAREKLAQEMLIPLWHGKE